MPITRDIDWTDVDAAAHVLANAIIETLQDLGLLPSIVIEQGKEAMNDPTEEMRRDRLIEINAAPGSREALEGVHGQVWDTNQMIEDFEVIGFLAPAVVVRRRSDGVKGSLEFQHFPRYYFSFQPHHE